MKKNKFITSTIILIIGSILTKFINMGIRILVSRVIGSVGMGVYMLVVPIFSLFISLSQMGLPVAISKLVSEKRNNNKNIIASATITIMIFNVFLLAIIFLTASYISNYLLQDERTYKAIISMALVLPFISISSILRGYYFGKQRMFPHVFSNTIEDIIRMILIFIGLPIAYKSGLESAISFIILTNIASESVSIIILLLFTPKGSKFKVEDLKPNKENIKNIFKIGIPTTGSRLISSIGGCLESIILTFVLLKMGYSNNYILSEYGIINGFILPIVLLPSFFSGAIASSLLPIVSEAYVNKKYDYIKSKLKQALSFSFVIGLVFVIFILIFGDQVLLILYKTKSSYLKLVAPFFIIYYLQAPLSGFMQAIGLSKEGMLDNLVGIIIKLSLLFILGFLKIGLYNLIIALIADITIVTFLHFYHIKKDLKNKSF